MHFEDDEVKVSLRELENEQELDDQSVQDSQAPLTDDRDESSEKHREKHVERETWGNKAEFILATIGLAVGLGNIWRFPYLCQKNGGGAFLVPFFIFMIIEGFPLFFIELGIGQRFRKTAVQVWMDIHPALTGIGVSCVIVSFMLCVYYIVVVTWCSYYFFISFTKELPWEKNTCAAYPAYMALKRQYTNMSNYAAKFPNVTEYKNLSINLGKQIENFPDCCVLDTPQWYWYNRTLQVSSGIEDIGSGINGKLVGCLAFSWAVVYFCIMKGIKSSGKVVYFTATFPYVVLIILFFRGITLDGASDGVKAFFTPDWSRLAEPQIWMEAATQIFFSLSLGFGALIAFASYNPTHNNIVRDAYIVILTDCATAVFGGVVVFSILGHRQKVTGIPVTEVGSGPGLAFVTFSDAMLLMDVSPLWAVLFFIMLILLGIDSEFGTLEGAIAPFYDLKLIKMKKTLFIGICVIVMFLIGLSMVSGPGYYIFQIFDEYSVTLPLLIITLFQSLAISWVYGADRFADDIEYMTGSRPWFFWLLCWKYISPLALIIILVWTLVGVVQKKPEYTAYVGCTQAPPFPGKHPGSTTWTAKYEYPGWGQFLAALIVISSTIPIPYYLIRHWPSNWKQAFQETFCTGIANYMPDPSSWKKRHGRNSMVYEAAYPGDDPDKI